MGELVSEKTSSDKSRSNKVIVFFSFLGRVSHTINAYKLQVLQKVDRFSLFVLHILHEQKKTYHVCKMKTFHITSLIPQAAKIPDVPH